MTLETLVLIIGAAALIYTLLIRLAWKAGDSWVMSFLQSFTGFLFLFSGWVKAVDPLGTAFKMEEYFGEFEATFEATWFSFLAPLFPALSQTSVSFSVIVIALELLLGALLIMGHWRKFTAWMFLLVVLFFTMLTGFTFLTGFVPSGENFFHFAAWGPFQEQNMRVTDCGCFGDFLVLKPSTSFLKDVILIIPALFFVFRYRDMHSVLSYSSRTLISGLFIAASVLYCFSNFYWNIPHLDFRPFSEGTDVRAQKNAEEEAIANVEVTGFMMKNKGTGEKIEVDYEKYMSNYEKYSGDQWETLRQIQTEPRIEQTEISDFSISDPETGEVTDSILQYPGYSFLVVGYRLYGSSSEEVREVQDTTMRTDTVQSENFPDSTVLEQSIDTVVSREESYTKYKWDSTYLAPYLKTVQPFTEAAQREDIPVYYITGGINAEAMQSFKMAVGTSAAIYSADDILLKTIIRANPGIILMKDGTIIEKWHYKKLPEFEKVKKRIDGK